MDELFLLPSCPVAMPRAYWLYPEKEILSSQILLVEPSSFEFNRIMAIVNNPNNDGYDMEIVNTLYRDHALVLPHRRYDLLTSEFRSDNHSQYLGSDIEIWNPTQALKEAKFVHFSDWPVPKPWIPMPDSIREEREPKCHQRNDVTDCTERDIWNNFYADFTKRRHVCAHILTLFSLNANFSRMFVIYNEI